MDLSPSDIEAFLSVAETGSFSRAGAALGLSQPAVSARIGNLEKSLGVRLFHRTTRRVAITDHGERLRMRLEQTMVELRGVMEELRDEANLRRGRVTVGASPTVAAGLLANAASRFRRAHPSIEIVLIDDFYGRALDRVLRGEVELAVIPFEPDSDAFDFDRLLTDRLLLALPANHRLTKRRGLTLSDVAGEPLIIMPQQTAVWNTLKRAFETNGLVFNPALYVRNVMTLPAMVQAGAGITFIAKLLTLVFPMPGITLVDMRLRELDRQVGIVKAKDRTLSPAANAFCLFLREEARLLSQTTLTQTLAAIPCDS